MAFPLPCIFEIYNNIRLGLDMIKQKDKKAGMFQNFVFPFVNGIFHLF